MVGAHHRLRVRHCVCIVRARGHRAAVAKAEGVLTEIVIPAKAGIKCLCFSDRSPRCERKSLDSRLRGNDDLIFHFTAYNAVMVKPLYKVSFFSHGKVYELYARHVDTSRMWGFTEVGELVFDINAGVVVDPTEERLRDEFGHTKMLHLPMQSVLRVEEVERKGQSAIRDAESGEKVVTPFPIPARPR
jgi:hypothetical protein